MTISRKQQVDLAATPYYHCINRCVRRAFLCGDDKYSGNNFDHRRGWMVEKIMQLSGIFLIETCAYAIMSNHFHLVLRVNLDGAAALSDHAIEKVGVRPAYLRTCVNSDASLELEFRVE